MTEQQSAVQRGTRAPAPYPPRRVRLGRGSRAHGHGRPWGLLALAGLGLGTLATLWLLAPPRPSPEDKIGAARSTGGRADSIQTVQAVPNPTAGSDAQTFGSPTQVPLSAPPEQTQGTDQVASQDTASPSAPAATKPAPNPSVAFEDAPGVLSISLRTRRKESLKAYPTETLGAIALGLEDLRLTPSPKEGQLTVNLGMRLRYEQSEYEVPKRSRRLLDGIGRLLAENPDTRVQILSHTDDEGDAGFNLRLSQRRADALKGYLVSRGVAGDRIIAVGRGEEAPLVATGRRTPSRAVRAKNRRTELIIESLESPEEGEPPEAEAATTLTAAERGEED